MTNLLLKLLKRASLSNVSKEDLHLQLLSHGDYPSLRAITDTLDYFGIENVAANVPKEALEQLPKAFLALIQHNGGNELVFVTRQNNAIVLINEQGEKRKESIEVFKEEWLGTIIAIEVPEKPIRKGMPVFKITGILITVALLTIVTSLLLNNSTFVQLLFVVLSLLGVGISYLISKESLGEGNTLVAKVCGAITTDIKGCGAVINSNQSVITKDIGLGDLSLIYFVSTTLACTILGVSDSIFLIIAGLSLPVVAYTLVSQAFVLKQWCFLCLGISAILISQFVVLWSAFANWDFSFGVLSNGLLLAAIVALAWLIVKPLLVDRQKLRNTQKELLSIKRDTQVFEAILSENTMDDLIEVPSGAIVQFGKAEAPIVLTAYTNPLCGFCKEAFEGYDTLLTQYPEDIAIQFVFNTPPDTANVGTQLSKRIIELYAKDSQKAWEAMRVWFATKDIDAWYETYGKSNTMLLTVDHILEAHRGLTVANEISYTPETLIGESKLSRKHYSYNDLGMFVHYLKEKHQNNELKIA